MIESFVDLSYRGLSLGRRIKLGQVRPHTGYLELAAPMPVGTQLSLVTDDGVTIDATVTWVFEQVTGADRAPGMVVSPALAAEPAAAWWRARVELPHDDAPRPRITRSRPVTLRPRSQTLQTPPPEGAVTEEPRSVVADLAARVAAAAGVATPSLAQPAAPAVAMQALDPTPLAPAAARDMRSTGEHVVIDDGRSTVIMQAVDPAELGIEPRTTTIDTGAPTDMADPGDTAATFDAGPAGEPDPDMEPTITIEAGTLEPGAADAGDGANGDGEDGDAPDPGASNPAVPRGSRKRKRRR